jgi:pyruvate dehydrogenase E1 component alpha subunit
MIERASRGLDLDGPIDIGAVGRDAAIGFYRSMTTIRRFEEAVQAVYLQGGIASTVHLSNGQEAIAVGAVAALQPTDWILGTHRGHGQVLCKGMAPGALMAELMGRMDGCCRGFGGSMHVGDMAIRAVPALAVMGDQLPIACGLAFAARERGLDEVVLVFVGDGAMSTGAAHEGLNLAAVWDLPVVVVCENNFYAISTPLSAQMRVDRVADRAAGYGMPGVTIDGNDVVAVHQAVSEAVGGARAGEGPTLVEALTYRQAAHKGAFGIGSKGSFRDEQEMAIWSARDPLLRLRDALLAAGEAVVVEAADREASDIAAEAVAFAEASPPAVERPVVEAPS